MKSSERTIVFTPKLLHSFTPYTKQVILNHESHKWTRMGSQLTAQTLNTKHYTLNNNHKKQRGVILLDNSSP